MTLTLILSIYNYAIPIMLAVCLLCTCAKLLIAVFYQLGWKVYGSVFESFSWSVFYSAFPLSFTLNSMTYLPIEHRVYQFPALLVLLSVCSIGLLSILVTTALFIIEQIKSKKHG